MECTRLKHCSSRQRTCVYNTVREAECMYSTQAVNHTLTILNAMSKRNREMNNVNIWNWHTTERDNGKGLVIKQNFQNQSTQCHMFDSSWHLLSSYDMNNITNTRSILISYQINTYIKSMATEQVFHPLVRPVSHPFVRPLSHDIHVHSFTHTHVS